MQMKTDHYICVSFFVILCRANRVLTFHPEVVLATVHFAGDRPDGSTMELERFLVETSMSCSVGILEHLDDHS